MIAADTSVVTAAALVWEESHASAAAAVAGRRVALPTHVAIETYSVLTRLPRPRRLPPAAALAHLRENFESRLLELSAAGYQRLLQLAEDETIAGGAIYDAVVAATAIEHGATLLTLDRRAERVYRLVGVDFRLI